VIYWLNRRIERAVAAYLTQMVPGEMRVYRSGDMASRQFPCAVVRAHTNRRFAGQAHACNVTEVSVLVMTEFAKVIDGSTAKLVEAFEDIQERCVSAVLEALYLGDGELATALTETGTAGVSFSYASCGSGGDEAVTSQVTEDGPVSVVEIPVRVHAGAVEE
jgi:hypothetical protein